MLMHMLFAHGTMLMPMLIVLMPLPMPMLRRWRLREERIRAQSAQSATTPGWHVAAVIVKADDDLRQEMFCMHLIGLFITAFRRAGLEQLADGLRPYSIQVGTPRTPRTPHMPHVQRATCTPCPCPCTYTCPCTRRMCRRRGAALRGPGDLEQLGAHRGAGRRDLDRRVEAADAQGAQLGLARRVLQGALPALSRPPSPSTASPRLLLPPSLTMPRLLLCCQSRFRAPSSPTPYEEAQRTCMHSVAAYSIVQYILHLKDRHNGNILIDSAGRLVRVRATPTAPTDPSA